MAAECDPGLLAALGDALGAGELCVLPGADARCAALMPWFEKWWPARHGERQMLRQALVILPIASASSDAIDGIVCFSEAVGFHEQIASGEDVGFLKLACQHIDGALTISRARQNLERRVQQRTRELALANSELERGLAELRDTQQRLLETSRRAGMAEVATSVLHNVGNVLNSVNVSAQVIASLVRSPRTVALRKAIDLLCAQPDPGKFLSEDPRGAMMLRYFSLCGAELEREPERVLAEIECLDRNIEHIKVIVALQQSHAQPVCVVETVSLPALIKDALALNGTLARSVRVTRDFCDAPEIVVDRHKLMQIVINLLTNASDAVRARPGAENITVRIRAADELVSIEVIDDGVGIAPELRERIFAHGFTTQPNGHGFGLHASACMATELGGHLSATSEGLGRGATFTLVLPCRASEAGRSELVVPATSRASSRPTSRPAPPAV
jgi:signal transduction histidine kinase